MARLCQSRLESRYAKLALGRLDADIFPHLGRDDIDGIEPPRLLEVIRKIEARGALAALYLKHRAKMLQWWADFIDQQTEINRIAA